MAVSREDQRRFQRIRRSLEAIEQSGPGTAEGRRGLLAVVNARRAADGTPPLADEDETRPEEGFYRRARRLGMARTDR